MKKILAGLSLILMMAWPARASVPSLTYQVAISSATTNIVSIGTTFTQADSPVLPGRVVLEVQNIDASANLWCRPDAGVTSGNGRKIAPGNSWILSLADNFVHNGSFPQTSTPVHIYCVTDGGGATNAAVTQAY